MHLRDESAVGRGTTVDVALPLADSASELRLSSSGSREL
jgi:hypothetical protein